MTDQPDDLLLERRLRDLAGAVVPPDVAVTDDLDRGRGRVRHRRLLVGAVALVVATGVGGATLLGQGPGPGGESLVATSPTTTATDPAPVETPSSSPSSTLSEAAEPTEAPAPPPDPRDAKELLTDWRDVIAEYLDPQGTHLEREPSNLQSGAGLGTKLGWSQPGEAGLGMVQVFVSETWADQWYLWCDRYQGCRDVTVDGIRGRVLSEDGSTWVGVEHPEGFVVALSVEALFGNNSTVPVDGLDVSVDDLVRVAADERFSMPTPEQVRGSGTAFGFPSP